jgi:hypothetical protein
MLYRVYFEIVLGSNIGVVLKTNQIDVFLEVVTFLGQFFHYLVTVL